MSIPKDRMYTKDHEWARIDGKNAIVGITDFAQHALGDITFVDLPKVGAVIRQGEFCATVESVKAASDVYAPFSGKVVSVNEQLASQPQLINQSPCDNGYFFVMEVADMGEKAKLMEPAAYETFIQGLA